MSEIQQNLEIPKFKLIFLGDQGTGKSSILNRFINDKFEEEYQATIGLDFNSKNVKIDNQDVRLLVYDTAGQEKFRSLIPMYTRDANVIILVYDITRSDSFLHIPDWIKDITNFNKDGVIICCVGNKIDLADQRAVTREEGEKFAKENGYIFEEVSAKTGDNFSSLFYKKLFESLIMKLRVKEQGIEEVQDIGKVKIESPSPKKQTKKLCC